MNYQRTNQSYLKNQVMSASPTQLISMLMAGAIKNIKLAARAIDENDKPTTHAKITLAQDIIMELKYSINQNVDGSVGPELINLYNFMYERLVQANIKNDSTILNEVAEMLTDLLATWKQLEG